MNRTATLASGMRQAMGGLALALTVVAAGATMPSAVVPQLPEARPIGQATLRFWGLHIYDAQLWAPAGFAPEAWARQPLALELRYARALRGADIAQRSVVEMRRQPGFPAAREDDWLQRLRDVIPDVAAGDRLLGVFQPGQGVQFFHNGRAIGEVRDSQLATLFFGIWLAPETSEPRLRSALLGLTP